MVDARDDQVGARTEQAEVGEPHAVHGSPLGGEPGGAVVELDLLDPDRRVGGDRARGAAAVGVRGDHPHLDPVERGQLAADRVQALGPDPIVVREQYQHFPPTVSGRERVSGDTDRRAFDPPGRALLRAAGGPRRRGARRRPPLSRVAPQPAVRGAGAGRLARGGRDRLRVLRRGARRPAALPAAAGGGLRVAQPLLRGLRGVRRDARVQGRAGATRAAGRPGTHGGHVRRIGLAALSPPTDRRRTHRTRLAGAPHPFRPPAPAPSRLDPRGSVKVSVVVPTRDRPQALARCLAALAAQDTESAEVVVVDDGSHDRAEVERAASEGPEGRLVRLPGRGPAAARNIGARAAAGDVVCFTDDDCEPQPDWLRLLATAAAEHGAATGRTVAPTGAAPVVRASQAITNHLLEASVDGGGETGFAPTCNLAVARSVLMGLPFDERFPDAAGEDRDWTARAVAASAAPRHQPRG